MKRWIICIILFCALILLGLFLFNRNEGKRYKVLIIQSYEPACKSAQNLTNEIEKDFDDSDIKTERRTFYLDCESVTEQPEIDRMYRSIDSLNTLGWKPDIILVNDDQATYSLLQSHHPLLHTVPIVFAGVSFPNWKLINQYKNITGFEDKPDILANLMLLSQIKETDKIVFTTLDVTFIDKKIRQEINKAVKGKKVVGFMTPNIPDSIQMDMAKNKGYILFQNYSLRVSNSTTPSFLWTVGHFGVGRSYLALKRDFTSPSIPRINNGFNFTAINEEFNEDQPLLGGYFSSMETQAKDQVDYAVKILKGASVSSLPICQSKKEYLFDWNAMKQIGLGVNDIPPYCKIINIPGSVENQWG